jgi:hypothetical protein
MAGQDPRLPEPVPQPAASPDEVAAAAGALITEWRKTRPEMQNVLEMQRKLYRQRWWQTGATVVLIVAVVVSGFIFGKSLGSTQDLAQRNSELNKHLALVVACQDAYDQRLALVLQARARASQGQTAALETLITETLTATTPGVFRRDVDVWKRALRAAQKIPVPPLPPAACR